MTDEYIQRGAEWFGQLLQEEGQDDFTRKDHHEFIEELLRESGALSRIAALEAKVQRFSNANNAHAVSLKACEIRAKKAEKRVEELEGERLDDKGISQLIQTIEALRDATDDEWKAHMLDGTAYILKTYVDSHREMKMRLRDTEKRIEELEKAARSLWEMHMKGLAEEDWAKSTWQKLFGSPSQVQQSDE